jgi:hypothetical protein
VFITQIGLEPVLLEAAGAVGARIEYSAEAVSVEQDADGVTAVVRPRDGGPERTVRARYLVAADGAHSPIRERLGIRRLGHGSFSDSITIYFRADVRRLMGDRNLSVIYVFGPRLQGFFRFSIDLQAASLVVNSTVDDDGNRSVRIGEDMSRPTLHRVRPRGARRSGDRGRDRERPALVRVRGVRGAAARRPRVPRGRLGARDAARRRIRRQQRRPGRLRPRVEARVRPRRPGDESLLDTYDAERQPVGAFTTEQAYTRYVLRLDPSLGKDDLMPIVPEAPVELGYRHRSDAVLRSDDDETWEDPAAPPSPRLPRAARAGHGRRRRAVDPRPVRAGFVLLAGPDGASWCAAAGSAGVVVRRRPPAYRIGVDVTAPDGVLEASLRHGAGGAVLVRPDGFVAWRRPPGTRDPRRALPRARRGPRPRRRRRGG